MLLDPALSVSSALPSRRDWRVLRSLSARGYVECGLGGHLKSGHVWTGATPAHGRDLEEWRGDKHPTLSFEALRLPDIGFQDVDEILCSLGLTRRRILLGIDDVGADVTFE